VSSHSSPGLRETVIQSQIGKLAECDESLSLIASDVTGLQGELAQLRDEADSLARLLSDREASLTEKELALSRLEEERALAQQQADGASAKLHEADARLSQHDERVAALEQELQTLRAGIEERERRLADSAAELSRVGHALLEREHSLEQERGIALSANNELADWRRRSDGLLLELASATADQKQLEAALAESRSGPGEARRPEESFAEEPIAGHLRFMAFSEGYTLSELDDPCPRPGDLVEVDERQFLVARTGRSPLPADSRPCAFLFPG
jgi:chromosome segregation ATPase